MENSNFGNIDPSKIELYKEIIAALDAYNEGSI